MKFGSVEHPENIDFTLPKDHKDTAKVLAKVKDDNVPNIYVGCAKWNKADLKGFYPKGTKDDQNLTLKDLEETSSSFDEYFKF